METCTQESVVYVYFGGTSESLLWDNVFWARSERHGVNSIIM